MKLFAFAKLSTLILTAATSTVQPLGQSVAFDLPYTPISTPIAKSCSIPPNPPED